MGGTPCFYGTRVLVAHRFEGLEGNYTVEQFADEFVVPVEQVRGVSEVSKTALLNERTRSVVPHPRWVRGSS